MRNLTEKLPRVECSFVLPVYEDIACAFEYYVKFFVSRGALSQNSGFRFEPFKVKVWKHLCVDSGFWHSVVFKALEQISALVKQLVENKVVAHFQRAGSFDKPIYFSKPLRAVVIHH